MIRFTEEEDQRLSKLLRKRRLSGQAFGHAAIMKALNKAELGEEEIVDKDARKEPVKKPSGLGIRDRLEKERTVRNERNDRERERGWEREREQEEPRVTQVVSKTVDDEVMALARTVVESPKSTRKETLKAACHALARGRTLDEALRLADELTATIRKLESTPQTALERVRARMGE